MPYAVYYQRLASDFLSSDLVILIGYSFNDLHFNRLLKSFIHINLTNKVLVVDKYPDIITMTSDYTDENNIIVKIAFVFGPEWGVLFTGDNQILPMRENDVRQVNADGFGEIFDRVFFYRNGYEEFLKNQEAVLSSIGV